MQYYKNNEIYIIAVAAMTTSKIFLDLPVYRESADTIMVACEFSS